MTSSSEVMIRVDQAGEFGATRIYAGQLAVMGDRAPHAAEIAAMAAQEADHRKRFDALMAQRGVRRTVTHHRELPRVYPRGAEFPRLVDPDHDFAR